MLWGIAIGALLGILIGYLYGQLKNGKQQQQFEQQLYDSQSKTEIAERLLEGTNQQLQDKISELQEAQLQSRQFEVELNSWRIRYEELEKKLQTQKEELKNIQEQFKNDFKSLAGEVLKEQSKDFKEKNESVLQPFREQIKDFHEVVRKQIDENLKNATSFKLHIDSLKEMNLKISEEAKNLTKALKGDTKQQGNWGELILEKILEASELQKGIEYETQFSDSNNEGKRIQPDVVIHLPEEKHLIIDAKVSLIAYERYVNATEPEEQDKALKEHLLSIKTHIKGLAEKNYQTAKGLTQPDFVLMFIPIESSFGIAVREDVSLFNFAWDRKIVLVSPSTLLATLKTIASIWKQEKQNRNVLAIAEESGKLYDKFVGFMEDLESIETNFGRAAKSFDEAKKKLGAGRGNIIGKIEQIKKLGAKAQKKLDDKYLEEGE